MTNPVSIHPTAYVDPHALVGEGAEIGARTRVWAFAHVVSGAIVGANCNLCDHTFVEGKVRIGARVTIKCGVYLWDGLDIEDDVFIGPAAVFTNDTRPRSLQYPTEYPVTRLARGCSIGAGAIVLPGIAVGRRAMIGAGSVVTRNVPDHALVFGNPARFHAWVCTCSEGLEFEHGLADCGCGRRYKLASNEYNIEEVS